MVGTHAGALPTQQQRSQQAQEAKPMDTEARSGWWQASDGYWYPPDARPDMPWHGDARGPNGELAPGPGWWLASDYQWYPPDARPGEVWADPVAVVPGQTRSSDPSRPYASVRPVPMPTSPSEGGAGVADAGPVNHAVARRSSSGRLDDAAAAAGLDVVKGLVVVFAGMLVLAATKSLSGDWSKVGLVAWLPIAAGFAYVAYGAIRFARSMANR
jgi:hypothetical protein